MIAMYRPPTEVARRAEELTIALATARDDTAAVQTLIRSAVEECPPALRGQLLILALQVMSLGYYAPFAELAEHAGVDVGQILRDQGAANARKHSVEEPTE